MTTDDGPRFTDSTEPVAQPEAPIQEQPVDESSALRNDIDPLLADPAVVTLSDGRKYRIERLKTRGTLRLLAILTGGAQDVLSQVKFSLDMDPQEFAGIFIGSIIFSIPEQEDATMAFIQGMVNPVAIIDNPRTPQEREANANEMRMMIDLLDDPELEDTTLILTTLITIEAPNILSLGKRIATLLDVQRKSREAKLGSRPEQSSSSQSSTGS